jgi:hypothetical protein
MQTTMTGGRQPAADEFPVRFGDEPATGRLPLRQRWQLPCESTVTQSWPESGEPRLARAKFVLIAAGRQGEIRALNERALADARQAVERAHDGRVRFAPPQVHTYVDPLHRVPMEPLMFVKASAPREHLDTMLHELRARVARMHEVELQGPRAVLRAEVRLRDLLGFEDAVSSAQVFSWLVRYEPALPGEE